MLSAAEKEIMKIQLRVIVPYITQIASSASEHDELNIASFAIKALSSCNDILDAIAEPKPIEPQNIVEIERGVLEIE